MKKNTMVITGVLVTAVVTTALLGTYAVSVNNSEVSLRNTISAKQQDNESEYDSMWKKISQAAQVTDAQKQALLEILRAHAEARSASSGGAVINWLKESVPNIDTTTFNNLQNIIAASRDRFTVRQKELLDLKQRHDSLLDSFPSGVILSVMGREKISVVIISSSRAEETFKTGTDDNIALPTGDN